MGQDIGTVKIVSSSSDNNAHEPATIIGPIERWHFTYESGQTPLVSSHRKQVYRGTFSNSSHRGPLSARALAFDRQSIVAFGTECANLGRLTSLGVGPKLLAITQHSFGTASQALPTIIEEDAGESLAELLARQDNQRTEASHDTATILHESGSQERELENKKILYDVFTQIQNAHEAGLFHRDLRCENVCVRRYGEDPADIKATIIDFELGDTLGGGEPSARAPLFRTVFSEVPSHLTGKAVSLIPNPLELDMGYLAALQFQLEQGALLLNGEAHGPEILDAFTRYLTENVSYFRYRDGEPPHARRIDSKLDIDAIAKALGLTPVNEESFPSRQLLEQARTFHRPYLDGEDLRLCMAGPKARLNEMIDDIVAAKFESYKALQRSQHLKVKYERYDDQPMSLQKSNYAQAEHIPVKVNTLGYLLVSDFDSNTYDEITSFSDEQVETLACIEHDRWVEERLSAGWTFGQERNPISLTSPYLIPYDELPESIKEYDRDPVRQIIDLVKIAGLRVVRPK